MGGRGTSAQRRDWYENKRAKNQGIINTHKIVKDLALHEEQLRPLSYERAQVWDQDGNLVLMKNGSKSEIQFSKFESKLFKDAIMTHNHPTMMGNGFSDEDLITFLKNDMAEMRAVDKGGVFSIKRIKGVKQDPAGLWDGRIKQIKKTQAVTDEKYQQFNEEYRDRIISYGEYQKRVTALNREFFQASKDYLKDNAKHHGYHYSFEVGS